MEIDIFIDVFSYCLKDNKTGLPHTSLYTIISKMRCNMEKIADEKTPDYYAFDSEFPDGRLVESGCEYPHINMIDAYKEFLRLGRPLTDSEFEKFIVPDEKLIPA